MPRAALWLPFAAVSSFGFHLILRLGDDRVIAPSRVLRRRWASELCALAREFDVIAWKLADTHLHIVVLGTLTRAEELIRRLRIWVSAALRPGVPLEVQRTKPLAGQSHLESAFFYVLRQDDHHGVETDLHQDSSAVLDVLGLRVLSPELAGRVRERLPRLTRPVLLSLLGVAELGEAVHVQVLADAAAAAFGLVDMEGNRPLVVRARRAAVAATRDLRPSMVADALGLTPQAVCRLRKADVPTSDMRAVRLQMCLRIARAAPPLFVREPAATAYE